MGTGAQCPVVLLNKKPQNVLTGAVLGPLTPAGSPEDASKQRLTAGLCRVVALEPLRWVEGELWVQGQEGGVCGWGSPMGVSLTSSTPFPLTSSLIQRAGLLCVSCLGKSRQ